MKSEKCEFTLRSVLAIGLLWVLTSIASAQVMITTATQLQDCVGANNGNWGATCTLATGTIPLYNEIYVSRSGITIQGDTSSHWGSSLTRYSSGLYTMMLIEANTVNVTLSNLVFNGAADGQLLSQSVPQCDVVLSGTAAFFPSSGAPISVGTPQNPASPPCSGYVYPQQYYDLDIQAVGANYNVSIVGLLFEYSPSYSVRAISNVSVTNSYFEYVGYTGLLVWARPAGSGSLVYVYNNIFVYNGGGGVVMDGMNAPVLAWNGFTQNHYLCFDGSPGGQIDIAYATVGADVWSNVANGNLSYCQANPSYASSGLEMYGSGHYVGNNYFGYHLMNGVGIASGSNITLAGNTMVNNIRDGIALDEDQGQGCGNGVFTISSNNSSQNQWWGLQATRESWCPDYSISLSGNTFVGNTFGSTNIE